MVLSSPTGSGKTKIASEIFSMARSEGKRVAFVVPFLSLIEQTYRAFVKEGLPQEEISIVQANHPLCNYARPIQICSVDTLARRPKLPEVDMIVFDEVHRRSKVYKRWMDERPEATFIGLSATPWARGMAEEWDGMIMVATTRSLIDEGYLSEYRFFAPASPDLSEVSIVAGDYHEGELGAAMNKTELVADIVKTWMDRGDMRPTLCFAVNRAHAREIQSQFERAHFACGYVDAYTPVKEREDMIAQLKTGHLNVIVNIGTMTTGVDAPFVSCIILARPTRSDMLYIQIIGRGLRTDPGKTDCLILDHSDTGLRLGLPCSIVKRKLSKAKADRAQTLREQKERELRQPKKCPKCTGLRPVGVHKCPHCGFEPERRSDVIVRSGHLAELAQPNKALMPAVKPNQLQEWYRGLLYIAHERNYAKGWASHKFKEKFGVWPSKELDDRIDYPTAEMRQWVKSRQIAFAKSKMKQMGKTHY